MGNKIIIGPLAPPQSNQIRVSQEVRSWLEPNSETMKGRNLSDIRKGVAEKLATRMGGPEHEQNILFWLELWVNGRTTPPKGKSRNAHLVALQLEAKEVFGGITDHLSEDADRGDVIDIRKKDGAFIRELLVAMYFESQEGLKAHGIDAITLWRGERGIFAPDQDALVELGIVPFQPISSFTYQRAQAIRFAGQSEGALILVSAPASRILATPATGFGLLPQREKVIFAVPNNVNFEDEGIVIQWRNWEDWQEISTLAERDWIHLVEELHQAQTNLQED